MDTNKNFIAKKNIRVNFKKFGLNEKYNFLTTLYSEEHGEARILSDDPVQLAAGFLYETLDSDQTGMIVIVRGKEMAFVIKKKEYGEGKVCFKDFERIPFTEAGRVFNEEELDCFSILTEVDKTEDGKRLYKVMANTVKILP